MVRVIWPAVVFTAPVAVNTFTDAGGARFVRLKILKMSAVTWNPMPSRTLMLRLILASVVHVAGAIRGSGPTSPRYPAKGSAKQLALM
jgi:hypothetical protein